MKKILWMITILLSFSTCAYAKDITDTVLTIDETAPVKTVDAKMFGVSSDWLYATNAKLFFGNDASMTNTPDALLRDTRGQDYKIPLSRAGGGSANTFYWKKMLNDPDAKKKKFGIPEYVRGNQAIDPDVEFSFTLNLDDTDENICDLVRFLTLMPEDENAVGSDGTNWAAERIRQGIPEPVPIAVLTFGNELDWLGGIDNTDNLNWTTERYIARCQELIPQIRAINPDVPLGVFSKTATSGFADHGEAWNKEIILNLGPDVDVIAFHNYYHINNAALLEMDGYDLEVIEKFISAEYDTAHLKIFLEEHGLFEDWSDLEERVKIQSFKGAMTMAMHFCRRLQDPMISMATFHGISGEFPTDDETNILCSEVMQAYRDENHRETHMLTSNGEILRLMYQQFAGKTVVESTMAHKKTSILYRSLYKYVNETPYKSSIAGWYPHVNSVAAKDENGVLTIMFANRGGCYPAGDEYGNLEEDITVKDLELATQGTYKLVQKIEMYANPEYDLGYDSRNTLKNPDQMLTVVTEYENPEEISTFTVEPRKITILTLVPAKQTGSVDLTITNAAEKKYLETVTEETVRFSAEVAGIETETGKAMLFRRGKAYVNAAQDTPLTAAEIPVATLQTGAKISMPQDAKDGMYTLAVRVGDVYTKEEFYYEKPENQGPIQSVTFLDMQENVVATSGIIQVQAVLAETVLDGTPFAAALCRGETDLTGNTEKDETTLFSQLAAIGQAPAEAGMLAYQFHLPKSGEHSGTYTLFIGGYKTEFVYQYTPGYPVQLQKVNGNAVWLGENGIYAALDADEDLLATVYAACYSETGVMTAAAADKAELKAGNSIISLNWQTNGLLNKTYITDGLEEDAIYVPVATETVDNVTPLGQDLTNGIAGITSGSGKTLTECWKTSDAFGGSWFQTIYQVQKDKLVSNSWAGSTDIDLENQVISLKTINSQTSLQAAVVYQADLPDDADGYVYRADLRNYFSGECNPVMGIRITDPTDETKYYELALISNTDPANSETAAAVSPPRFAKVQDAEISTPDETMADTWQYAEYGTEKPASGCYSGNGQGHHCDWYTLELTQYKNGALSWRIIRKTDGKEIWNGTYLDKTPLFTGSGKLTIFTYGGSGKILADNAKVGAMYEKSGWKFMLWNGEQQPLLQAYTR